jgi:tetratricopeptide (TPR) repeat protein
MRIVAVLLSLVLVAPPACAQHRHEPTPSSASRPAPLFEGLGPVRHPVSTRNPTAQKYFDQGLRLSYAFNHEEAGRSFREAARLDSTCAMAWWGAALVLGPNINLPMSAEAEAEAYLLIQKARVLAPGAGEAERAYIEALGHRYGADAGAARASRDSAYANAMRGVMKRYPDDLDAAVLAAEALMDLRPWDLWTLDGKPQPGTEEIVAILEGVLKRSSDHTGAIHLYVHAVEASPEPGRAERHAERLAELAPYAGHLVHMPTHIHLRLGKYDDAVELNERAVAADRDYIRKHGVTGVYPMMYYPHNIHMRWSALLSQGRRKDALEAAAELEEAVPLSMVREMPMVEFFRVARHLTMARFGLWEEALREKAPEPGLPLTTAAWRYARGLGLSATGKEDGARAERDSLAALAEALPADAYFGLNPAAPLLRFAAAHLSGEIAFRAGRLDEAVRLLTDAAGRQDSLRYDEPPPWQQTARQSLGAALLAVNRPAEAEAAYREDLARYPENGWSLYGLTQALRAQKKTKEAGAMEARFRKAWAKSDMKLQASRY